MMKEHEHCFEHIAIEVVGRYRRKTLVSVAVDFRSVIPGSFHSRLLKV